MESNAALKMNPEEHDQLADQTLAAISTSFATIEFSPDGTIIRANDNFLGALGYSQGEVQGRHHRMFVDAAEAQSLDYRRFWEDLASGRPQTREFKRVTKNGTPIWIKASYMPVRDRGGKVVKVVKVALDSTADRLQIVDLQGKMNALSKSQAVIEFKMDGTVVTANDNFLHTLGYTLKEIEGQHHSMFCEETYRRSHEYRQFWEALNRGEFQAAEYRRIGKGGKEVWIQASYNPVMDMNGKPCKVVKFATDVTKEKMKNADYQGQLAAISKAQAVIEFNLDGSIITANDNFLSVLGYSLNEIQGKHHSMFVEESYRRSSEYRQFWDKLNRGEFEQAQYKRIGKGGKEVWIQASYNPIFDMNGRPFKVVKFAVDITDKIKLIQELSDAANTLAASAQQLNASATQMAAGSKQTTAQATQASAASEEVSKGVEAVATNTEEMQASIKEISRNANEASSQSNETKAQAQQTNLTIQKLGESSKEIGNVIKVISSIAQQTNLLALNATIEAARAGDAGRGFAVVANEVKELAKQTAKATEEITNKIGAIQTDSSEAVKAISGIGVSIDKLNAIAGAIAASVEEQAATTGEVARVVKEANIGVQSIASNVKEVSVAATQTSQGAGQVSDAARSLQELATRLSGMVKRIQN